MSSSTLDDRAVVVDDRVQDRPSRRGRTALHQLRVPLEVPSGTLGLATLPVADSDHGARPEEDVELPEHNLVRGVVVPRGLVDDEVEVV